MRSARARPALFARCVVGSGDYAGNSMSIMICFRNVRPADRHATAAGGGVYARRDAGGTETGQQPFDQREAHAAGDDRELAGEGGERAVAQPQRLPVLVGLVTEGGERPLGGWLRPASHELAAAGLAVTPRAGVQLGLGSGLLDRLGQQVGGGLVGAGRQAGGDLPGGAAVQLGRTAGARAAAL